MTTRPTLDTLFASVAFLVLGSPAALYAQAGGATAGFPIRPVRIVVPFTPGGQPDIFSRIIAQKASEGLGQSRRNNY